MNETYQFKADDWGPLAERYSLPRPRKMLALDGGGIRGIISLRILKKIEDKIGKPLGDYFDYIAGTSTGAIIAGCLAVGMSVERVEAFYISFAREVFKKRFLPFR